MKNPPPDLFISEFETHVNAMDASGVFRLARACTLKLEDVLQQGFEEVNEGFNPGEGTQPIVLVRASLLPVLSELLESPGDWETLDLGEAKIVFDFFKSEHPVDLAVKALQNKLLMAGSDEAMNVYTNLTNTLEKTLHGGLTVDEPLFFPAERPARTLYVVFAGMVCFPEFKKSLRGFGDIDQLHVLDPTRSWYMRGPEGEWNGYEHYTAVLRRNLDALKAKRAYGRVCFLGNSMGAAAACLFSEHADAVLAFCPQTVIPRDTIPEEVKDRYQRLLFDNLTNAHAAGKRLSIHRGVSANDIAHCDRLPPGIEPIVHEGCDAHNLPGHLKSQGVLLDVLGSIRHEI